MSFLFNENCNGYSNPGSPPFITDFFQGVQILFAYINSS